VVSINPSTLPSRPHLEHLKKQAKDLLSLAQSGDADALRCFGEHIRRFDALATDPKTLTLAEAQHALAKSYGFASWPLLKNEVLQRRAKRLKADGLPEDPEERLSLVLEAVEQNDEPALRLLLELDPSLADGFRDRRPLALAAERDLPNLVDVLLDAGASFEPDQSYPHSPLSWSLTTQSLRAARRLAERGAPVDLWCAAGLGDVERMRAFFDERGQAKPKASRFGATRFDAQGVKLDIPTDPIEVISDALYIACRAGQLDAAQFLLDHGARPSFLGYAAAPALHWAAFSGNQALIRVLLERGADATQTDGNYQADYRQFAIRIAIEWSWLSALERVLAGDSSLVHERRPAWGPPLHAAAQKGLPQHVKALIDAGADVHALDHTGRSARDCAALSQDPRARDEIWALLPG
jgi:ankyrin repeat protein